MKVADNNEQIMTYKEYKTWEEGDYCEVLDGHIISMASSPSFEHQQISGLLHAPFVMYLKGKKCSAVAAPTDVYLFENKKSWNDEKVKNWVIPDISVVCDPDKIDKKGIIGAPDLIIEIVSPSSVRRDRMIKLETYQRAGVKEYWVVEPRSQTVDVYILENGFYKFPTVYTKDQSIKVNVLDDLTIDLMDVFPEREDE